jgi:DNA modification methylase
LRKYQLVEGNCKDVLKTFPSNTFQCCVTSPPYWQLRDYFVDGQLGHEETPEQYVDNLVSIAKEIKRVLRKDSVFWLNIGDGYNKKPFKHPEIKQKDLIGIPWAVAFALRKDGWYLRQDVVWKKENPIPDGAKDRPTRSHEYIFQLTKSKKYFYDYYAVLEESSSERSKTTIGFGSRKQKGTYRQDQERIYVDYGTRNKRDVWSVPVASSGKGHFAVYSPKLIDPCVKSSVSKKGCCPKCRSPWKRILEKQKVLREKNKELKEMEEKDVFEGTNTLLSQKEYIWEINEKGWEPTCKCNIKDTTPCLVLDPFNGSGTSALVSFMNEADYVGIDINDEYLEVTRERFNNDIWTIEHNFFGDK